MGQGLVLITPHDFALHWASTTCQALSSQLAQQTVPRATAGRQLAMEDGEREGQKGQKQEVPGIGSVGSQCPESVFTSRLGEPLYKSKGAQDLAWPAGVV